MLGDLPRAMVSVRSLVLLCTAASLIAHAAVVRLVTDIATELVLGMHLVTLGEELALTREE